VIDLAIDKQFWEMAKPEKGIFYETPPILSPKRQQEPRRRSSLREGSSDQQREIAQHKEHGAAKLMLDTGFPLRSLCQPQVQVPGLEP
jgi:hypothetical protein